MSQIIKNLAAGPVPPSVATTYHTDSGDAIPAANILNIYGGTGAATTGAGNTVTVNVTTTGFDWEEQNTDFNIAIGKGYFCNAMLTATLPASGGLNLGDTCIIYVDTTDVVTIQAGAGEQIQVGSNISAVAGTAASNTRGAILELVFKPSDSTWHTISSLGVWSIT